MAVDVVEIETSEQLIFDLYDWTEEEFKVIKKMFGVENENVIEIVLPKGTTYEVTGFKLSDNKFKGE